MTVIRKTVASEGDGLDFVLSDATVDRYGDSIVASGWDLKSFETNPIALFGHSHDFPIGRWSNLRIEGGKLIGKLNLAARGTSARIDELISLVEQGILRAVSVGFLPKKSEPIDKNKPYGAQRYLEQELLETSLVSVPANPAAIALAKSMHVSEETMSLAFGEQAETRRRDVSAGEQAPNVSPTQPHRKAMKMEMTLSKRIETAQEELNAKRDRLVELNAVEELDLDAIEALNGQIEVTERTLKALKDSEAKIGVDAGRPERSVPAAARKPLGQAEKNGFDLFVRALVVEGIAHHTGASVDNVIQQRYPGHEALGVITKADQTLGVTGTAGWASELVQTGYYGFLEALQPFSIFPTLAGRGLSLMFDQYGSISLPRRTAGGAGGGFVGEGSPIKVGRITTAAATLTPKKMGVIVPFSRELAERSTPSIEAIVRQAILEDTAAVLDPLLLDATAVSAARPAGLLNGVSAAASGYAGGDYQAVREDFKALLAPFFTANAADGITVIVNPTQGLNLSMMEGPIGDPNWLERIRSRVSIVESTSATAGRLVAIRNSDFVAAGGNPSFDVSEQATIHMEDTTPLEIVSGTGPTTADPVRSLWQTNSMGVRMVLDVSWTMRRTGVVQWINGTSY
jgi:HK97 family phage prohead protease/HK97 family phage major capsid protein